jgi:hypothetical protein
LQRILTTLGVEGLTIKEADDFAFIHLHRVFEAVVSGRRPPVARLWAYLRSQAREERSAKRWLAFAAFCVLLALAPDAVRRRLVVLRTDPTSRPGRRRTKASKMSGSLRGFLASATVGLTSSILGRFGAQATRSRNYAL